MKKNVLAVALALMASIGAYAEKNTVSSPDGKLNVVVEDRDGKLYYSIDYAGKRMMEESQLGLLANVGDFSQGLTYQGKNEIKVELIVTKDMTERKTKMIELGDVFIAFPGGTGTLEEIAEVMSKVSLKHLEAPCILYNLNGYYDSLKALLLHMTEMGLSSPERQEGIYFAKDLSEIRKIIENQRSNATITPPENTQGIGNQLG